MYTLEGIEFNQASDFNQLLFTRQFKREFSETYSYRDFDFTLNTDLEQPEFMIRFTIGVYSDKKKIELAVHGFRMIGSSLFELDRDQNYSLEQVSWWVKEDFNLLLDHFKREIEKNFPTYSVTEFVPNLAHIAAY